MNDDSILYTLIVRDRDRLLRAEGVDGWDALTLVASLSADPRTFDELRRAYLRYRPEESLEAWPWRAGSGRAPEGAWILVDLAAMRLVAGGGAELPEPFEAYEPDEPAENEADRRLVWIHLPPQWQSVADAAWQQALVPLPIPTEPLDARGVLFGRALAEGIARRTRAIAEGAELPSEPPPADPFDSPDPFDAPAAFDSPPLSEHQRQLAQRYHALTVRVHADWLLAPREDLAGEPPRTYLHRDRDWVDWELDRRQLQWSMERRPPRPIDRDTFAYRHGPLGRHEVVMYFDLCRAMIHHAWQRLSADPAIDLDELTEALHQHAARWLAEPSVEYSIPPADVIEQERRRLPLVGGDSHLDCDCPLCRMGAEGTWGPMFCGYDGHHLDLDGEFAFSLSGDRELWQEDQEDYLRMTEQIEAECRHREQQPADPPASDSADAVLTEVPLTEVWQRSMVDWDAVLAPGVPTEVLTMGIGFMVSELIGDLKEAGSHNRLVDRLNAAFDDYRRAADDPSQTDAAHAELAEVLEQIAAAHRPLTAKAADLQSRLAELRLSARPGR